MVPADIGNWLLEVPPKLRVCCPQWATGKMLISYTTPGLTDSGSGLTVLT